MALTTAASFINDRFFKSVLYVIYTCRDIFVFVASPRMKLSNRPIMSYTSVVDESMIYLRQWTPGKSYIQIYSHIALTGQYVIFEPNFRFTKYDEPTLVMEWNGKTCMYLIELPCSFNPDLYFMFGDVEFRATDLLGTTQNKVLLLKNDDNGFDDNLIVNDDIEYNLTDEGDLKINDEEESKFCVRKHDEWVSNQFQPYFFQSLDLKPSIVFPNEVAEYLLLQTFCNSATSLYTIDSFVEMLTIHFLDIFTHSIDYNHDAEFVKLIYENWFRKLKPGEVLALIGNIVQCSNNNGSLLEQHFICCVDKCTKEMCISKTHTANNDPLYSIEFFPRHLSISTEQDKYTLAYDHKLEFKYGFIFVPK